MLTTCKRKIVDYYIDDYDILYIHDVILSQLLQEKKNLNQFINELNSKEEEFKKSHTYNVKKDLQSSIDVLKTSIDDIKKDKINIYKCQINTLLDDYILTKKNKNLIQKHK